MNIREPRLSPHATESAGCARRFRSRAVRAGALLAIVLLGGCDSSIIGPGGSSEAGLQRQKLAEVQMQIDLRTGTILTTVHPTETARKLGLVQMIPSGPRMISNVNGLLTAGAATCLGCNDGVLGWHQISVPLTNSSVFTIIHAMAVGGCNIGECIDVVESIPPSPLSPSQSYTQSIAVNVVQQKFSVFFSVYGDLTN